MLTLLVLTQLVTAELRFVTAEVGKRNFVNRRLRKAQLCDTEAKLLFAYTCDNAKKGNDWSLDFRQSKFYWKSVSIKDQATENQKHYLWPILKIVTGKSAKQSVVAEKSLKNNAEYLTL